LNNQNGTFTPTVISIGSGAGSGPQALAVTGTGNTLLLAVANFRDNTVSVLQSDGNGAFGAQKIVAVGKGPDDVNFADFNGDGIPDLAVSNYTDGTVNLVLGSSGGTYSALGPFSVGDNPYSAAVGDLDSDGTPDIVVSNCFSNNTGVLLSGTQISVQYSGLALVPGDSLHATYTPDGSSKYATSTSPNVTAP
jgi:DNA-binding beta-propeller fold protein YncE